MQILTSARGLGEENHSAREKAGYTLLMGHERRARGIKMNGDVTFTDFCEKSSNLMTAYPVQSISSPPDLLLIHFLEQGH